MRLKKVLPVISLLPKNCTKENTLE